MRASKHATHSRGAAQEIFEISITRLQSEKADLPVVATAERDAITLFAWNEGTGKWVDARIEHAPIEAARDVPSISNLWNWSRRIGLASAKLIYVVYKRAPRSREEEAEAPPLLVVEGFRINNDGSLQQVLRVPVRMPTFTRQFMINGRPRIETVAARPGFELWAGVDAARDRLLIVTQTLGDNATPEGDGADLTLLTCEIDRLDEEDAWDSRTLDAGGYGLDVRQTDDALTLVYRNTPHSLRVPLPIGQIDPLFGGWPELRIDASPACDPFFTPLQLMRIDLVTLARAKLQLPGGEHPRIQNIRPLLVVADRPQLRVRFRLAGNAQGGGPQIDWELRGMDKLASLLDDTDRIARGSLMSFRQGDSLPRPAAPWEEVQDLYQGPAPDGVRWASTWGRFPLEPQALTRTEKGFFFDFLHKTPDFALHRSRVTLSPDFDQGLLAANDFRSLVYDINHAQIGLPADRRPDVTGENAQFAPFERLFQNSGNVIHAPGYLCDNTIGGTLISDRDGVPYQFLAYTDLGDGGLRVIYDADLGPPDEPPPVKKPKTLEPASVPGPGSGDERWVELSADDWQDAGLPAIVLGTDVRVLLAPTITSTLHARIEALLQGGVTLANLPIDFEDGTSVARWSKDDINSIQTELNRRAPGSDTRFAADGLVPRAFIQISPAAVWADAETTWRAGIEGGEVAAVNWEFTPAPAAPNLPLLAQTAAGNPVTFTPGVRGDWTVHADMTLADGSTRSVETVVTVVDSLFRLISALHRGLSEREPDPTLDSIGGFRIGTATFRLLQYELRFPVGPDEDRTHGIEIKTLDTTDAQWRFRANETRQGVVDYRFGIRFETQDVRLEGLLSTLTKIERVEASFFYGRSFTPGILMNDTRSTAPVTGAEAVTDKLSRGESRLASALTARPFTDGQIMIEERPKVKVSMLPQAIAASVVTLLLGLGAATAAATLLFLLGALGAATAAAALPFAGVAAAALVVAAAVAVFLFIALAVPPKIEEFIADRIEANLRDEDRIAESQLLQFAGEGVAEAIARQVITTAIGDGASLDPPPLNTSLIGDDRFRQDLFQMIHVSDGRCRVLIRTP